MRAAVENSFTRELNPHGGAYNSQLDIKLGQFTGKEFDIESKIVKSRQTADLDEIPHEVWKTRKFDNTSLIMQRCIQTKYDREIDKRLHLFFFKKGDLAIIKIYRDISFYC